MLFDPKAAPLLFFGGALWVLSVNRFYLATAVAVVPRLVPTEDLLMANSMATVGGTEVLPLEPSHIAEELSQDSSPTHPGPEWNLQHALSLWCSLTCSHRNARQHPIATKLTKKLTTPHHPSTTVNRRKYRLP